MGSKGNGTVNPLLFYLAGITALVFIMLILQSSFLVDTGQVEDAIKVGLAATALITFIFSGALVFILSILFPKLVPRLFIEKADLSSGARNFSIGFLFFFILNVFASTFQVFNFAILNVGEGLFSQISQILGGFNGYYLITIGSPVAEEFLFFIALPMILLALIVAVSKVKALSFLKNRFIQHGLVILIVAPIFAFFHLGQAGLTAFFFSAMIFRGILLGVGTDTRKNFIPFIGAGWLFAIGGHMANNIQVTGGFLLFVNNMLFLPTDLFQRISGILILIFFVVVFGTVISDIITGKIFKVKA